MNKGGSSGGGQSSLGYLFGSESDEQPSQPPAGSPPPPPVTKAPWDDDNTINKPPSTPSLPKLSVSNNYHRPQGQNSGNFITDRPTTKVQSPPGGDSSIGYLFGDK